MHDVSMLHYYFMTVRVCLLRMPATACLGRDQAEFAGQGKGQGVRVRLCEGGKKRKEGGGKHRVKLGSKQQETKRKHKA